MGVKTVFQVLSDGHNDLVVGFPLVLYSVTSFVALAAAASASAEYSAYHYQRQEKRYQFLHVLLLFSPRPSTGTEIMVSLFNCQWV